MTFRLEKIVGAIGSGRGYKHANKTGGTLYG